MAIRCVLLSLHLQLAVHIAAITSGRLLLKVMYSVSFSEEQGERQSGVVDLFQTAWFNL